LIAELTKNSSDLQELTRRKEKDIDLTNKKITMLREQLQAAERILAVNERSLSSFKAEKSKIDTKLLSMQYEKKIEQVQLHNVLVSISTTTPTSNPTTSLVAAKTMATTTLSKQTHL
jgi:phosphoenolpyruvate carboxylase